MDLIRSLLVIIMARFFQVFPTDHHGFLWAAMSEPPPAYNTGEVVLCYHGPLIYVAKILKTQSVDDKHTITGKEGTHYFVHYKGWKTTWDEWVPAARLLKDNEVNRALQKSLQKDAPATAAAARSHPKASTSAHRDNAATSASATTRSGTRGTKRGRDDGDGARRPEMKLNIPEQIKAKLVDDWETVTRDSKLVALPRSPTVQELLKEFEAYLKETKPPQLKDPMVLAPTVVSGLLVYFDRSLANHLLYRFERPQYTTIRQRYITGQAVVIGQEKEMSEIYGAEHLLRMLVTLPTMIAQSTLDAESTDIIRDYVNELLAWMLQEQSRLFQPEYDIAPPGYMNTAKT
ncbi:MRG-domain-containing protein [Mycena belliarum]|uniref:Chromatin modification-related protein EAF3 n=1 Tax=Mycena belliarum TaxID=1033014 RepID=A0AAD6XFQ0_9AGAR|nr:MRG-domain-containing protein [Mycena belliae]